MGRAAADNQLVRAQALAEWLPIYLPAIKQFLIGTCRVGNDLVDDLVQDFVADKVLANKFLHHADKHRGKFRNLLAKALVNYTATWLKRQRRVRATELTSEFMDQSDGMAEQLTEEFDQEWLEKVVREALEMMQSDCIASGRTDVWEVFRVRVADPILHGAEPMDYRQVVEKFGIQSPRQAINLLATAKRSFLRSLRKVLSRSAKGEADIDREIHTLVEIVTQSCATR